MKIPVRQHTCRMAVGWGGEIVITDLIWERSLCKSDVNPNRIRYPHSQVSFFRSCSGLECSYYRAEEKDAVLDDSISLALHPIHGPMTNATVTYLYLSMTQWLPGLLLTDPAKASEGPSFSLLCCSPVVCR